MEAYRHQLHTYQTSHGPRPLLEEFIPLKNMSIEESEKPAPMEKANWMVSAQLWSSPTAADATERSVPQLKESAENCFALISKPRCGGAFHPFSKDKNKDSTVPPPPPPSSPRRHPFFLPFYWGSSPELALASVDGGMEEQIESRGSERWTGCKVSGGDQPQSVATPKQIRELMKVDGLTNDEVKSHLRSTDCTPEGRCRRPRGGGWAAAGGSGRHLGPPGIRHVGSGCRGAHNVRCASLRGALLPSAAVAAGLLQTPSTSSGGCLKLHGHLQPLYPLLRRPGIRGVKGRRSRTHGSDRRASKRSREGSRGRREEEEGWRKR
ncbi:hypothetical protein HPP92_019510 [Vanilla planifolia]|uniref:Uncharacterized protein n=1 Tax=Vanilla planifolia TaxID=51239 RepID=A0A835Q723_VANPL|nr:hypothetical protein HPP92_019510 [Vanilla planifolia]